MSHWWNWISKRKDGPGLETKFKVGEYIPWKGISFMVKEIDYDKLVLRADGLTWQMFKKIKEKGGRQT